MCWCDYEVPPVYSRTLIKKARKPHRCDECHKNILIGASFEKVRLLSDGEWKTFATCVACKYSIKSYLVF